MGERLDISDWSDDRDEIEVTLRALPDDYTVPNISPPTPPLCCHSERTATGWASDCDERATWEASWLNADGDAYYAWFCDDHRHDIDPTEWERR